MRSPSLNPGPYHTKQQSAARRKNIKPRCCRRSNGYLDTKPRRVGLKRREPIECIERFCTYCNISYTFPVHLSIYSNNPKKRHKCYAPFTSVCLTTLPLPLKPSYPSRQVQCAVDHQLPPQPHPQLLNSKQSSIPNPLILGAAYASGSASR